MNQAPVDPYARPTPGYQTSGQPGSPEVTSDGFRVGMVAYRFGTAASVVRDLPGWYVADGTQPAVVIDGVSYQPNLTKRVILGADGSAGFAAGDTGGSDAHVHPFTHELAHGITQPVFAGPAAHTDHGHSNNHSVTQPSAHADHSNHLNHSFLVVEFTATGLAAGGGTGLAAWAVTPGSGTHNEGVSHDAHSAHTNNHSGGTVAAHGDHTHDNNHGAPARTTDVALTNNAPHAGGSVDAATGANKYPPYVAVWPIIKVY